MLPWLRRLAAGLEQARRDRAARRAEDAARLAALSKPPEPPVDPIDELMRIVRRARAGPAAARQGAGVSKAPPLGPLSGLQFHKPEDDIGVGLARPAHGPETVDDGRLDPNQPLALRVRLRS
jgi:hypothetical protein